MIADLRKRALKIFFWDFGAISILKSKNTVKMILRVKILPRIIWAKIVGSI
jgi:hypothetical protein